MTDCAHLSDPCATTLKHKRADIPHLLSACLPPKDRILSVGIPAHPVEGKDLDPDEQQDAPQVGLLALEQLGHVGQRPRRERLGITGGGWLNPGPLRAARGLLVLFKTPAPYEKKTNPPGEKKRNFRQKKESRI